MIGDRSFNWCLRQSGADEVPRTESEKHSRRACNDRPCGERGEADTNDGRLRRSNNCSPIPAFKLPIRE